MTDDGMIDLLSSSAEQIRHHFDAVDERFDARLCTIAESIARLDSRVDSRAGETATILKTGFESVRVQLTNC